MGELNFILKKLEDARKSLERNSVEIIKEYFTNNPEIDTETLLLIVKNPLICMAFKNSNITLIIKDS